MPHIDKVALISIREKKILMARSHGKSLFYLPGGKREGQETDQQTLVREIKEELNVDIQPESIRHYHTFEAQADGKDRGILVRSACYYADYLGVPQESHEIAEIRWMTTHDRHLITDTARLVFDRLQAAGSLT